MKKTTVFVKTTLFSALLVGLSLSLFWACNKESTVGTKNLVHDSFYSVAKLLVSDPSLKQSILQTYQQTRKEEFLLADVYHKSASLRSNSVIDELIGQNPLLTIAYPSFAFREGISFEDHLNTIRYYVVLDREVSENATLKAYTPTGELVDISSTFDEEVNYAVIKKNESLEAVNITTLLTLDDERVPAEIEVFHPVQTVGDYNLYSTSDIANAKFKARGVYAGDIPLSNIEGGIAADDCDRDRKKKDELHKVKFSSKSVVKTYESGFHLPTVELRATYAIYDIVNAKVGLVEKPVDINWKTCSPDYSEALKQEILTWNRTTMGDYWQVAWVEWDGGKKTKLKIPFKVPIKISDTVTLEPGIEFEIDLSGLDIMMGSSIIEYCDPANGDGDEYKPVSDGAGGFFFREHIRD